MRRLLCFILTLALTLPCLALAEETPLTMNAPGETVRPGRAVMLSFTAPAHLPLISACGSETVRY